LVFSNAAWGWCDRAIFRWWGMIQFGCFFLLFFWPFQSSFWRTLLGNLGKNECWGEKGSRAFLSRFIDIQVKLAASGSSDSASRVVVDVGCNKGDYVAELSPLLEKNGALGAAKMPDVTYHGFEAMPQNCKFIEQVSLLLHVCLTLKFVAHTRVCRCLSLSNWESASAFTALHSAIVMDR
jgi:hypothetical protein